MEEKLDEKAEKYGGDSWRGTDSQELFYHLELECRELFDALLFGGSAEDIRAEAADVGNMAMMIFDNADQIAEGNESGD